MSDGKAADWFAAAIRRSTPFCSNMSAVYRMACRKERGEGEMRRASTRPDARNGGKFSWVVLCGGAVSSAVVRRNNNLWRDYSR